MEQGANEIVEREEREVSSLIATPTRNLRERQFGMLDSAEQDDDRPAPSDTSYSAAVFRYVAPFRIDVSISRRSA